MGHLWHRPGPEPDRDRTVTNTARASGARTRQCSLQQAERSAVNNRSKELRMIDGIISEVADSHSRSFMVAGAVQRQERKKGARSLT